jgi:uncharacterized protein (TIGR02147 family)
MAKKSSLSVFEFESYRSFLNDFILAQPNRGRGWGARIAGHTGCHTSFVSQVLSGRADFSVDQAFKLSSLLGFTEEETDYFLLLVSRERAGFDEMKGHYTKKITEMRAKRKEVVHRIGRSAQLKAIDQMKYYSSWHYALLHVLCAIPQFRTKEAIGDASRLELARVAEVLQDLEAMGLVEQKQNEWHRTERQLHLPANSPMIQKHHQNWRLKALESVDQPKQHELHYSSLVGIAKADAEKIQEAMLKAIDNVRGIVRASPEEEVYCYTLDFFQVVKGRG